MIKVFIFDFGGVIYSHGVKTFIDLLNKKHGISREILVDVFEEGLLADLLKTGKLTEKAYWEKVKGTLHLADSSDDLKKQWLSCYEFNEKTADIISLLSKKFDIYFLTDNSQPLADHIRKKFNVISYFKGGVFSFEVGVRKPDVKIYKLIIKKYKLKPNEAIFVDDKEKNLLPAQRLGMKTILFKTPEQFKKDLKKLKLNQA